MERGKKLMGTTIRPELSEKNEYFIEKHRFYELRHFCRQYPIWKKAYLGLEALRSKNSDLNIFIDGQCSDPTAKCAVAREWYAKRIDLINKIARDADPDLCEFIIKGVTEGLSYDILKARLNIPCCKDSYYKVYRRFFWLLNKTRD